MNSFLRTLATLAFLGLAPALVAQTAAPISAPDLAKNSAPARTALNPALPTLFVAGDSTAARGRGKSQQGWAVPFADYFDPTKVNVANRARGGRSSRTFITEGLWDQILADLKPGDIVLIQFGHNDGGALNDEPPPPLRARGSIPGLGEETKAIDNVLTKKPEVVHPFGWYMRKYIGDAKARGATPIVLSCTVRNIWKGGKIERGPGRYREWAFATAQAAAVPFIDLSTAMADKFESRGEENTKTIYPQDHTHFDAVGADLHAAAIVAGLKGLRLKSFGDYLSAKGTAVAAFAAAAAPAIAPAHWGDWPLWGDQGDSTYRNPVLPSDYSDLDCIRVDSDYYAISSTFQFSPGVVILHSRDLVNWRILGHVVSDLTQIGPELNWDRMSRYGRGVWAGAIRQHAGKFWVYFGTPDEGFFVSTAGNPAGPWSPLHRVMSEPGWDDCCPFWDDDGQGYLVGTNFKDGYKTWLFKLTPDSRNLLPESRVLLNEGRRREANKLYKVDGLYYHFFSEWQAGVGRYVMMQRATRIAGPYTAVKQLSHVQRTAMEPNQGGIVQAENGQWYFFTHHGTGAWEGRCASLLPVHWVDRWPILGNVGPDGIGTMVWSGRKPVEGSPIVVPQTDDDFSGPHLGAQWEWNHQPRAGKWSLAERPGFLRLHAFPPLRLNDRKTAGNTLTQRTLRTTENVVTVALDLGGIAEGQVAGLCHFAKDASSLGVRQTGGRRTLEFTHEEKVIAGPVITAKRILLRSSWGLDGLSHYAYSIDGTSFVPFGTPYQLTWGHYRGDRIGLYTYHQDGEHGFVDLDWFSYTYTAPAMNNP